MKKPRILLAEDSPTVLGYFQSMLEAEGFEVIPAADGLDATSKFFLTLPDLVVSDVEMPIMNGFHVCRLIKSEPETREVPFIMLTALTEVRYEFWGFEVGADRYVRKEDAKAKLVSAIRELLAGSKFHPTENQKLSDRYVDSFHILDRLNRMLDEKLFRMTLTNSVTSLAFKDISLADLARQILEILLKVIHASCFTIVILDTEEIHFYVHSSQSLSAEYIEALSHHCLDYLEGMSTISMENTRLELEYFCEVDERPTSFRPTDVLNFFRRLSDDMQMSLHLVTHPDAPPPPETMSLLVYLVDFISITIVHAFMQERIKSLSVVDSLTHLYNRGHFMSLLNAEYRRTIRHNLNLALIFIDIDNFKGVNDSFGHLCGDLVLKVLSEIILATIRTSDVAGRYGGEEFVVYLPETNLDNATKTAERIRRQVEDRLFPIDKSNSIHLTISLGVAAVSEIDAGEDIERILEIADQKLYRAKVQGKNRVIS